MSWSRGWSSASSGSTSRATEALERFAALAVANHRPRLLQAVGVRRGEPGHVDRRARVEDQGGEPRAVVASVAEQPLDAGGVDRWLASRQPSQVTDREAVRRRVDRPGGQVPEIGRASWRERGEI